ncbi:CHAT domain-containing protein [Dictyobacter formicarum]|uniref:TIR domain-containing protein n=1 Tax=Dictyobacter formicarum TaxID=2778368 RepID=A0ABQ3VDV9_9CHLR|nr:CHAT domain-containing protein [Dictyobacter formicarum]GHO83681.1 hypothetical protein KSZ_16870 [Dictyobacter formicarum]
MDNNEIVKILFLAASPNNAALLELDKEIRSIKENIRASKYANNFRIEDTWAVRDNDLLFQMNLHTPQIVHFSGHGTKTGELLVEREDRSSTLISAQALQSLFRNFKNSTRMVILNACNSHIQAQMVAEDIDFVIGMSQPIGDNTAIVFISAFYSALGFGHSIQHAFNQALSQLQIKNIKKEHIPRLFTRTGVDASTTTWKELLASSKQPISAPAINRPISIFISYAPEDDKFRQDLEKHFSVLRRNKTITITNVESTLGGQLGEDKLVEYLNAADIVLLLISPDFMSSDSLYDNELKPAMNRRQRGLTWVIPIIVRKTADWESDEFFGKLLTLPRNKKPVSLWSDRDSAMASIVQEVRRVIDEIKAQRS